MQHVQFWEVTSRRKIVRYDAVMTFKEVHRKTILLKKR